MSTTQKHISAAFAVRNSWPPWCDPQQRNIYWFYFFTPDRGSRKLSE